MAADVVKAVTVTAAKAVKVESVAPHPVRAVAEPAEANVVVAVSAVARPTGAADASIHASERPANIVTFSQWDPGAFRQPRLFPETLHESQPAIGGSREADRILGRSGQRERLLAPPLRRACKQEVNYSCLCSIVLLLR